MLENTPMPYSEHSNDAHVCQYPNSRQSEKTFLAWTRTGMIDTSPIIAAVVRAYTDAHLAADVTPDAIRSPSRATHVAHARHLCAYLLVEDYHLSYMAAAQALGRTNHTTIMNSRARVAAALDHDDALRQALADARPSWVAVINWGAPVPTATERIAGCRPSPRRRHANWPNIVTGTCVPRVRAICLLWGCTMPFRRPTTTPTPDEIFDEWVHQLKHSELLVLLYIVRRTFGFRDRYGEVKDGDTISLRQFHEGIVTKGGRRLDHGCGVRNKTSITQALKRLEELGLIRVQRSESEDKGNETTWYALAFQDAAADRRGRGAPIDEERECRQADVAARDGLDSPDDVDNVAPLERGYAKRTRGGTQNVPGGYATRTGGGCAVRTRGSTHSAPTTNSRYNKQSKTNSNIESKAVANQDSCRSTPRFERFDRSFSRWRRSGAGPS